MCTQLVNDVCRSSAVRVWGEKMKKRKTGYNQKENGRICREVEINDAMDHFLVRNSFKKTVIMNNLQTKEVEDLGQIIHPA